MVLLTLLADTLQGTREYYSEKEDTLKISFDDFDEDGIGDETNQNEKDYEVNIRRKQLYKSNNSSDIVLIHVFLCRQMKEEHLPNLMNHHLHQVKAVR